MKKTFANSVITAVTIVAAAIVAAASLASCFIRHSYEVDYDDDDDDEAYVFTTYDDQVKREVAKFRNSDKWGDVVSRTIDVAEPFSSIICKGIVNVRFVQGEPEAITVVGNEKVTEGYTISVSNGQLNIDPTKDKFTKNTPVITVCVQSPSLTTINTKGMGNFNVIGDIEVGNLDIQAEGMGDVKMKNVKCDNMTVSIEGMGDFKAQAIDAKHGTVNISAEGIGDINTGKIKCEELIVKVEGKGEADIKVKADVVYATAEGLGEIELEGTARKLVREESGMGKIDSRGLKVEVMERR